MFDRNLVIQIALAELGYMEKSLSAWKRFGKKCLYSKTDYAGADNYTKYGYEMNQLYPAVMDFPAYWCDCFVDWCFYKAYGVSNAKGLLGGDFNDYTKGSIQLYKNKNAFFRRGAIKPEPGFQVFFSEDDTFDGVYHTGLIIEVTSTKIYSIEGNSSYGTAVIPNGGEVVKKEYNISDLRIYGYGRPNYSTESKQIKLQDIPISCGSRGLKIVGATTLNIRQTPVNGSIIGTYQQNEYVQCTGKILGSDKNYWFHTNKGYISGKYLTGWIKESCNRWWYVKQGYTYDSNSIVKIDDKWYAFDKDGWMLEAKNFNSDGSINM